MSLRERTRPGQAQECRERALACARKAQEATEPSFRSMFADLAKQWFQLAEQLEELERRRRQQAEEVC
jgi:hypothetical protein